MAGGLFLVAVLLSLLPWDRAGELTSPFSAWVPSSDPWPLFAGTLALAAAAVALAPRQGPESRRARLGRAALGVMALLAALVAVPAPDASARSPVPFLVLVLVGAGTGAGILRTGRRSRATAP